jgi:hypothetical protein
VSEGGSRRRRTILLLASVVGLVIVVGITLAARRSETIPLGARKQWDDFAFAVVDVRRLDAIDGLKPSRGSFLVVRFGIRNKAKRVEYRFQP